jgi:hypothetical protein
MLEDLVNNIFPTKVTPVHTRLGYSDNRRVEEVVEQERRIDQFQYSCYAE